MGEKKEDCELLFLDFVARGEREGLCMPPRRFSSWGLLGIPGGFRMHSILLTKPCLCCSQRSCFQGLEAFAFVGGDHDPRTLSALSQVALCLGLGPPFMAASHLNDKDAFVGRTWWHRALRGCAPLPPRPSSRWLWWARGETEVPLCPHVREQRDRRNSSFL